jgi:hypothetical protein
MRVAALPPDKAARAGLNQYAVSLNQLAQTNRMKLIAKYI